MAHDFDGFKKASDLTLDWLKSEYAGIRTSQASPSILDGVSVEVYGSKMPINQTASISITGPKSLLIAPWDKDTAPDIDRAIRESNLGVSVALDSQGVRVSFPDLTSERRVLLIKVAKEKYEEARIRVRTEREKNLSEIDRKEKDGSISKDDKFRLKTDLQRLVDEVNNSLESLVSKKEKEILE
ncbi:MAG: ribosome recycling factor [Minisyncoccia bacterium]